MTKPFDATKFRKSITKSIPGLGIGFSDPTDWISTGNYALNYLISGDFNRGIPLGKVTVLAGEPQSGKSWPHKTLHHRYFGGCRSTFYRFNWEIYHCIQW